MEISKKAFLAGPRNEESSSESSCAGEHEKKDAFKNINSEDARILSKIRKRIKKRSKLYKKLIEKREKRLLSRMISESPPTATLLDKMSLVLDSEIDNEMNDRSCDDKEIERKLKTADMKLKKEKERNKMLRNKLSRLTKPKESYKNLKNMGLDQISNALNFTDMPYHELQKKTRMKYDEIKKITSNLEDEFDELIKEKLSGDFRATVKKEILKYLQNHNFVNQEESSKDVFDPSDPVVEIKEEPMDFEEEVDIQNSVVLNGGEKSDSFNDNLSLSSVHTSDLSSFEDEISISSEEGKQKRRVSFKFAAEEIQRVRQNKSSGNSLYEEENSMNDENGVPIAGFSSSSPRRARKPNSKYFSKDVMSPFDYNGDALPSTSYHKKDTNGGPRKRGRPRKDANV